VRKPTLANNFMTLSRWHWSILTAACLGFTQCAPTGPAQAPNPAAQPVNQLAIAGNACGPAAALNALRHGSSPFQAAANAIPGDTDQRQLRHVILKHGGTWSRHVPQRYRWSRRGINAADLTDAINELTAAHAAPRVQLRIPSGIDSFSQSYHALARSLRRGFPPVVGLRRYDGVLAIDSHFITILQVPDALDAPATEFPIRYLDPMGGRVLHGTIRAQHGKQHTQLIALLPQTPVGLQRGKGSSYLVMDALIVVP
jgi:hypothetical protein